MYAIVAILADAGRKFPQVLRQKPVREQPLQSKSKVAAGLLVEPFHLILGKPNACR